MYASLIWFCPAYSQSTYHIVAFGDFGDDNQEAQIRVRDSISELVAVQAHWYGFFLGDNFYPDGVQSSTDPQFMNKLVNIYQDLKLPFLAALGNHDHLGNIQAQIDFTKLEANPYVRGEQKLWEMPSSVYSRKWDEPSLEVFVLDTEMADLKSEATQEHLKKLATHSPEDQGTSPSKSWEDQMSWLKAQLKKSTAKWKFVIGHHPIISDVKRKSRQSHPSLYANYKTLENIIVNHAHLYICGHDHSLQIHELGTFETGHGPLQIISGSGGATHTIKKYHHSDAIYRAAPRSHGYMRIKLSKEALEIIPVVVSDAGSKEASGIIRNFTDFAISQRSPSPRQVGS